MKIQPINQNYNQNRTLKNNNRTNNRPAFGAILKNNLPKVVKTNSEGLLEKVVCVISAPSGTGKDTLVKGFNEKYNFFEEIITCTTRQPRPGEVNGKNYHFLSPDDFKKQIQEGEFLEYENVYGDTFYGTRRKDVNKALEKGKNAVLIIDVNGAKKIKEMRPNTVSLFITPPSMQELERRLTSRGTETADKIQQRLARAEYELAQKDNFDIILQNDNISESVEEMAQIFKINA